MDQRGNRIGSLGKIPMAAWHDRLATLLGIRQKGNGGRTGEHNHFSTANVTNAKSIALLESEN
jgi:hypothetical protein